MAPVQSSQVNWLQGPAGVTPGLKKLNSLEQTLNKRLTVLGLCFGIAGIAPGAPLCRAWSQRPDRDGLEIVLKGGQMGAPGFFGDVLLGCPPG